MLTAFLAMPRLYKRAVAMVVDAILLSLAFWGAFGVRLDADLPIHSGAHWQLLWLLAPLSLFAFMRLGLYRTVLRFVGLKVLWTVALGAFLSTIALVMLVFFLELKMPRTVPVIYFAFTLLLIGGARLAFRLLVSVGQDKRLPVLIYGAGSSGRQLLLALNQGKEFLPVAFVDDDRQLHKTVIHGLTVYAPEQMSELLAKFAFKKILLAMPSASRATRQAVIQRLEDMPC
ncbi:MAG: nucleoside-diphosphate sugar epimerase/dehydratase, partial [Aeromonas sp.]